MAMPVPVPNAARHQAAGRGPGRAAACLPDSAALARPVAGRCPMVPSDPSPMGHRPNSSTAFDALLGRVKIAPARFVRSGFINANSLTTRPGLSFELCSGTKKSM